VTEHGNLIVLRSLSKWAGLAGLRIGYGVFPDAIAEKILTIKQPYNINIAAQVALLASLADTGYLQGTVEKILLERERLFEKLSALDSLKPFPTRSYFILCEVTKGDAKTIHDKLQKKGIFIRYFDSPRLENSLRISVGKPEHTDALIAALKQIC
jgi:histidinol-phosphate aminotransferase